MTELTPEQQARIAEAIKTAPKVDLGLTSEKSGGGAIDNALSTARETMQTCAGCIRAHWQKVSDFFVGRQNS